MRLRLIGLAIAATAACAVHRAGDSAGVAAGQVRSREIGEALPRPGAPWPREVPLCEIRGKERGGPTVPVYSAREGRELVATIVPRPEGRGSIRWSQLPVLGRETAARVDVDGPFELGGWADVTHASFRTRRPIEGVPNAGQVPEGTIVSIRGTTGESIVIAAPTPLRARAVIEAESRCEDLEPGEGEFGDDAGGSDNCDRPLGKVIRDAPVRLDPGTGAARVALAHRGLEVRRLAREPTRGSLPIELFSREVQAPAGRRFWIDAASVQDDSGCPGAATGSR